MIGSAIIIVISRDYQIRDFFLLAKFAKIDTSQILPDLQYYIFTIHTMGKKITLCNVMPSTD